MSILANLGMDADHLEQAISLLTPAASRPHPVPARAAMTRGTLGGLLIQRAGFTASWRDLDDGISHLMASHDMTPAGHAYRVATGINLAGALLTRFLERGQAEDVDAARFYLAMAGTLAGPTGDEVRSLMADVDMVVAGNKGLLGVVDGLRGDPSALDEAVSSMRAALSGLPSGHPHGDRIRSVFGPDGQWESDEAFFYCTSFAEPGAIYRFTPSREQTQIWFRPAVPIQPQDFEVKQVWYESKDKTSVPMFLVYRKGQIGRASCRE